MNSETQLFSTYKGLQGAQRIQQEHHGEPLLFSISALGSFTYVTLHMGPTALRSIRRTKQWLRVLLKDTSVTAVKIITGLIDSVYSISECQRHINIGFNTFYVRHLFTDCVPPTWSEENYVERLWSKVVKGTCGLGSDELVSKKRLKPFVMKCKWLERCFKSRI